jgi:RHH-type transcriptional regulator, proline utilization regulon repressor / proline dehydrogenase / delta 1-pyrroline-5-carboxylate dehydrogenase
MIFEQPPPERDPLKTAIDAHYRADEAACVRDLLQKLRLSDDARARIEKRARHLVGCVRSSRQGKGGLDAFLKEYGLST